jgi:hypothetical protein
MIFGLKIKNPVLFLSYGVYSLSLIGILYRRLILIKKMLLF